MKKLINKKSKRAFLSFLIVFVIIASFGSGFYSGFRIKNYISSSPPSNIKNAEKDKPSDVDFSLFWQSWNELTKNFVGDLDAKEMVYGAINGMLASTADPYTQFFKPEENQRFQDDISGEFNGIGVELSLINGRPTVVAPLSGSPAEKTGIKAKDIILEVDGSKTGELGFEGTINKIRGEAGSKVKIKVERTGTDNLDFEVARENIKVDSVTTQKLKINDKSIFYIKIRQFGDDTDELFAKAVAEYPKSGASGIILDLRNNPGGYLDTAVNCASYFLDGGVVVSEINKAGDKKDFKTTKKAALADIKLMVLVNEGSASASEIFAGAMKDRNRATIIGSKTFGKGSVQVLEQLKADSAIKITVAKWTTPNGTQIDGKGIEPDVAIKEDENADLSNDPVVLEAASRL